jgi:hypothetical protein
LVCRAGAVGLRYVSPVSKRSVRQAAVVAVSAVLLAAVVLPVTAFGEENDREDITYEPLDRSAFVQQSVIDGWINKPGGPDLGSISGHGWDLWRYLNQPSGQELNGTPLPIWETWYSGEEVFLDNQEVDDPDSRDLDPPNQSLHTGSRAVETGTAQRNPASVLSFNRFNRQMLDQILQNGYYDRSVLQQLANGFDLANTPPELRTVAEFPNTSVMLKPVWWIVPGDAPSMLPYWAGETDKVTADTQNPEWSTWKQCVLVDPTGKAKADIARTCNEGEKGETAMKAKSYDVVPIDTDVSDESESDFYAFRLTQDEVDALGQDKMILDNSNKQGKVEEVEAGDVALLTAMHVSTREIENWTWQTFWWVPDPQDPVATPPNAQTPPSSIPAPFNHFNMCTAYFMTTPVEAGPAGEPWLCFNPYLESDLTGLFTADRSVSDEVGIHSNCMSCHRAGAFTATKQIDYVAHGYLAKSDPAFFGDGVITEFLWAMPFRAHDPPFVGPEAPTPTTAPSATSTTRPGG